MAPPNNRRSGFSRRAQYSTFFGYIAGIAGALVGAGFLVASIINPEFFSGLRGVAADVAAPAGNAVAAGRAGGQDFIDTVAGYATSGSRNAKLQKEVELARVRLAEAQAVSEENRRLKALLALNDGDLKPVTHARLVASSASSTRRYAIISAGRTSGVAAGMPVRSAAGLVGRVLDVSDKTARVLLITDTESVVPVHRARDSVAAFAQGKGDGTLQIRLINLGINPLKLGDIFVTSGSGGLYRPGTAVAAVTAITRDGAIARVLSDPSSSEFVAVEPVWAEVIGAVQPAATATASPAPAYGSQ
jgi:rod shape-determining protein MreC